MPQDSADNAEHLSLALQARLARADRIARMIADHPENATTMVEAEAKLAVTEDPRLYALQLDSDRRRAGMWIGAGLSGISIGGCVIAVAVGGPAILAGALLTIGAACAGATFMLASGRQVGADDFATLLRAGHGVLRS